MFAKLTVHRNHGRGYICKFNEDKMARQENQFSKCNDNECVVCSRYDDSFAQGYGKYYYQTVNHNNNKVINCESENLVYQIYCNACKISYVGETGRSIKTRTKEHIKAIEKGTGDKLLIKHFCNAICYNNIRVRVLHKLHDECEKSTRLNAETFWMHQLVSIFPFGLNDKVTGLGFAIRPC